MCHARIDSNTAGSIATAYTAGRIVANARILNTLTTSAVRPYHSDRGRGGSAKAVSEGPAGTGPGMRKRTFRVLGVVVIAVLAAGCGSDDSSGGGSDEPANSASLEAAAEDGARAIVAGGYGAVYDRLSLACQEKFTEEEWAAEMKAAITFIKGMGVNVDDAEVTDVKSRNVTDTEGEVEVSMSNGLGDDGDDEPDWEEWVYEEGRWRFTDCEPMEEPFGSSGDDTDEPDSGETGTTVGGELRPAAEVTEESPRADALPGVVGEIDRRGWADHHRHVSHPISRRPR